MTASDKIRRSVYYGTAITFLVPLILLWGAWTQFTGVSLEFVFVGAAFLFVVFVGRWDIPGYFFRPVLLLTFLGICFHKGGWAALLGGTGSFLLLWFLFSRPRTSSFVELSFPLLNGWYYVAHGGASRTVNYHAPVKPQSFALDILRLNSFGFRARGVYPSRLEAYAIFHDVLYSPCNGVVMAVENELPDLTPGEMDPKRPAGNHIVIQCGGDDTFVGLAHLAQGSVLVRPGDTVAVGQPLAKVGNSGNTSEPHLHIHAKRGGRADLMLDGEGVAIRFGGRWLIRNSVVHTKAAKVEARK